MHRAQSTRWALIAGTALSLLGGGVAEAGAANTGGLGLPEKPKITKLSCAKDSDICREGEILTVRGRALDGITSVVFLGRAGRSDDRTATPQAVGTRKLTVAVPPQAHSGRVRAVTRAASVTGPPLRVRAPRPGATPVLPAGANSASAAGGVFPIQGPHDLGQTDTNNFGGARNHKGQDMFAACGTPLVAALGGTVTAAKFEARAGNYAVITDPSGQSEVYMHMRAPALVQAGQTVTTGQPIGQVGETGRADGCHLHFELWTAPGWYMGGKAVDPLPTLKSWDARSPTPAR